METVKAYRATDGSLFPEEGQCEIYESNLQWKEKVSEFLHSDLNRYRSGASSSIAAATITSWELWKAKSKVSI
jgi:hypothetical protein